MSHDYDRTSQPKQAAKDSDARAAKFLAKWSKADADRLDGVISSFNSMDLGLMHRGLAHMQEQVKSVAEEDPGDVARYLKDSRSQQMEYWARHKQKRAKDMFDNIKAMKQFVTDWERAMKP